MIPVSENLTIKRPTEKHYFIQDKTQNYCREDLRQDQTEQSN